MPRAFSGAASTYVKLGIGANLTGLVYGTFAAIVKVNALQWNSLIDITSTGDLNCLGLEISDLGEFTYNWEGNGSLAAGGPSVGNGWCLIVGMKGSGNIVPTFYKYVFNTDTWTGPVSGNNQLADLTSRTPGQIYLGSFQVSLDNLNGELAAAAIWKNTVLTDAQIKSLATNIGAWLDTSPAAMWVLDQDTGSSLITDWMGDADETTHTSGVTIGTTAPPIGYGGPVLEAEAVPSGASSPTATPAALTTTWTFPAPSISVPAAPGATVTPRALRTAFDYPPPTISVSAPVVTYVKEVGNVTNTTTGLTSTITVATGGVPVDDTVVVIGACDNTGTSGAATTIAVTDARSNTYTVLTQALADPGAASAGVQTFVAYGRVTTALLAGDLITITYGVSTPAKGIMAEQFHNVKLTSPVVAQNEANNLTGTASAVAATATAAGQLVIGAVGVEGPTTDTYTQDSDTTNGTWVGLTKRGSGTTTSAITIGAAYKIVTAAGSQSYDVTITTEDHAAKIAIFDVEPVAQSQSAAPDLLYTQWNLPPATVSTATNATATPAALTTTWTFPSPSASGTATAAPAVLGTQWTFPAPTAAVSIPATATPAALSTQWTYPAVTVTGGSQPTPPVLATQWTYPAAAPSGGASFAPAVLTRAFTFPAPTILSGTVATPAALNTQWTYPAVSIGAGATVSPAVLTRTFTFPAPLVVAGGTPQPATLTTQWAFPAPAETVSRTATPAALSTQWTYPGATITVSRTATPAVLNTPWTFPAPSALVTPPLVYDDFTGTSIDLGQWVVYNRLGDQVNSEVNAVIPANVRVGSGTLKIDSKFETVVAGDTTTGAPNPRSVDYTSGQIAQRADSFLYGDIQVRAKIPGGSGLWPCIWMLGYLWQPSQPYTANDPANNWPVGGWWECDIAEFMGGHRTVVNNALHFITAGRNGSGEYALPFDATTRFMVYRLVWTATTMTWYVDAEDGVGWRTLCQMSGVAGTDIPNTPGYLIIHTAIGGVGGTVDSATLPQTMEVDYARVTQPGAGATPTPGVLTTQWTFPARTVSIPATASPAVLSRTWTFPAPTVAISQTPTPAALSTHWTYPSPSVSAGVTASPAVLSRTWTYPAPAIAAGTVSQPATLSTQWTFPAPSPSAASPATATPAALSTQWTYPAATPSISRTATPAALTTQWAFPAPAATGGATPSPSALATQWTYPAPSIGASTPSSPAPGLLPTPWTLPAPTVKVSPFVSPASLSTQWAYPAPTAATFRTATPSALQTTWAYPAPAGTVSQAPQPATLTTTWALPAPTVGAQGNTTATPPTLNVQWTFPATSLSISRSATPPVMVTTWAFPNATVSIGVTAPTGPLNTPWGYPTVTLRVSPTAQPAELHTHWTFPAPLAGAGTLKLAGMLVSWWVRANEGTSAIMVNVAVSTVNEQEEALV